MDKTQAARWISVLFNPLWVGALFFIWLVNILPYGQREAVLVLISGILSTVVIPLAIVAVLVKSGRAENMDVPDRKKRFLPFALFSLEYFIFVILNRLLELPVSFQAVMWVVLVNTLIYAVITLWWKVSIHAAGIAGYIVCVLWFLDLFCILAFLPLLLTAWSRVHLKAHTLAQVIVGSILGIALTYFQLEYYATYF